MRVPDQVRKTVVFVGLPETPDPQYRGTGFIVTVPGTQDNHFAFMVTARHVAEKLEGNDFYIRANKKCGGMVELRGFGDNPWWYHPTEREFVDCAVTLFAPAQLRELDVEHIPIALFADEEKIRAHNIGVGDEVFITGLFTKVTETAQNVPIVRVGNVAMMLEEKIPFHNGMYTAHLIESRSIGRLSGSPVFVRPIRATGGYRRRQASNSQRSRKDTVFRLGHRPLGSPSRIHADPGRGCEHGNRSRCSGNQDQRSNHAARSRGNDERD